MKEWIRDIVGAVIIAVIILQFIMPTIVKETSMQPSLYENDYVILSKQAYKLWGEMERGDIIVFSTDMKTDAGKDKLLIKRIIGLPGDTIGVVDGQVYRNGEAIEEDYTLDGYTTGYVEEFQIPEGKIFAMGDNRAVSLDSRSELVGCVDADRIIGKAVVRLYPLDKICLL